VRIANSDWAAADTLADIGRLDLAIRVWSLIRGDLQFPYIEVTDSALNLERDQDGQVNWDLSILAGLTQEATAPDDRSEFPLIDRLVLDESSISLIDAWNDLNLAGTIDIAHGGAGEEEQLMLDLEGDFAGDPLTIQLVGGSVAALRERREPYPVELGVTSGDTRMSARGTIGDPIRLADFDLDMAITGPDLAMILPSLHPPLPSTPPYDLQGVVRRADAQWNIDSLQGIVGDTDIVGRLAVDVGRDRPFITGELTSERLDFDDLAALIGGQADTRETAALRPAAAPAEDAGGLFPTRTLDTERLDRADVDLTWRARDITSDTLPVTSADTRIELTDRRLVIELREVAAAEGRIAGEIAINARDEVPSSDIDLIFENLDLKPFFRDTEFVQQMGGRFSGALYLLGTGRSVAEVLSTADGSGQLGIASGTLSGLLIEAAGLDLVEALALVIGDDARVPIRCGRVDLVVEDGVARFDRAIVDTTDSTLIAGGSVGLGSAEVNLQIEAREKDFSLIDAASPVSITGTLRDIQFGIAELDPLPFFEMGEQKDVRCEALLRDITTPRAQGQPAP
jgi:uncharacterized protein involved in outer membrane biogenesis